MSYTTFRYLYCDADKEQCPYKGEPFDPDPKPDESITEQRKRAHDNGWHYKHGEDHCKDCRARVLRRRRQASGNQPFNNHRGQPQ